MKINWGNRRKLVRVFFPNNTWQYQGFIYNIRTTSNIKKKGHFYKKVHLKFHHPMFKKFYNKINLCWYFIRVGPKVRCTFSVGLSLNMSQFNVLVVSLNLKIQKSFATHHIWILSLTGLFNLQISICLKCLVLNTGVILWSQPLTKDLLHNILDLSIYISFIQSCHNNGVISYPNFQEGFYRFWNQLWNEKAGKNSYRGI